ncbi:glycosyltransferase family 2 protein [Synechococcus sp. HJ21-Hayes]|uniref:glycosyltransferase family 2 protein n=1 Tax=unclassified Synechococcus TaxID=2626047 RepID=UPI0020CB9E0A|nr:MULTISPECIES: glycosyltransferase family 2 protein [unclassified Synechococcus]MCP9830279.1 glycosyltransferase family 2 protein [Synechococcus sp. JJ3a-Johnson]MCP9852996.1 glycosyltransferase family 2 protein [Synechococcus sp. HJ21-Hayes]
MQPSPARHHSPLLSAVVPFLNEAANLPPLISCLELQLGELGLAWELVLVDDGSTDSSLAVARRELERRPGLRATVLSLSRNFGKEAALTAGLEASRGEVVVPLDADLQDPPELIGPMLEQWRQGFDVVYAVRRQRAGESRTKRLTAFSFYRLMGRLSSTSIPPDTGDFRLMDRCVVEALLQLPERSRFMKGLFAWVGFRQTAITYNREPRHGGRSTWNYWKLWNFALDGITSFSRVPLQVLSGGGVVIALLALLYGAWMVLRTLLFGIDLPGYASLITAVLFLGGLQLIGLGVLGEYLGRVFEEVKGRPLYLVRERWQQGPALEGPR